MSIITEALKKAQEKRPEVSSRPAPSPEKPIPKNLTRENVPVRVTRPANLPYILTGVILAAFILVLLVVAISGHKPAPNDIAVPVPAPIEQAKPRQTVPEAVSPAKNMFSSFYHAAPAAEQPKRKPGPELSGIMYTPTRPQAVINGQTVYQGESVDGYTVVKIYPDCVKLTLNGVETEIKLK